MGVVLRGAGDLVAVVPHLLGYRPGRSLVGVGVTGAGRVVVAARVGWPAAGETVAAVGAGLAGPLVRAGASAGVLVAYG